MPEKQKPLRGETLRGGEALTVSKTGYSGNIPLIAINSLKHELKGLTHGTATLTIHIKDSNLIRYVTSRECSFIPDKLTTGSRGGNYGRDN